MARRRGGSESAVRQTVLGTVVGTALSIILAGVLVLTVSTSAQIGLIVALTGTILSALLGAAVTFAQRLDSLDEKILEGARLRELASMPKARAEVVALTAHLAAVSSRPEGQQGFFWEAGLQAVEDAQHAVRAIAAGTVTCPGDQEIFYVEKALAATSTTVVAVASRGLDWWSRPEADAYWSVYGRAARRLTIRRVFLVETTPDGRAAEVLDRHAALGMETWWVPIDRVPEAFRAPIVVFDQHLLHRSTRNAPTGAESVDFTNAERAIREATAQFTGVLDLGAVRRWTPGNPP